MVKLEPKTLYLVRVHLGWEGHIGTFATRVWAANERAAKAQARRRALNENPQAQGVIGYEVIESEED